VADRSISKYSYLLDKVEEATLKFQKLWSVIYGYLLKVEIDTIEQWNNEKIMLFLFEVIKNEILGRIKSNLMVKSM